MKDHDSIGAAKSLVNMAILQSKKGDFYGSIETSLEANNLLKNERDSTIRSTLVSNYNNMAISSSFLQNYDESAKFYIQALKYANIGENKFIIYNNIGDVLILQGKTKLAQQYLNNALLAKDSTNYSRALNNLAKAKFLEDKNYNPLPELYKALEIRSRLKETVEQNSSFATISDYFADKNQERSLFFANQLLLTAEKIKSPDDKVQALKRIINLDPKNYLENFKRFNFINDSIQTARSKAKNQFAIIRFDVEKIKAQNAEKEIQLLQRNIGLGTLSIVLIGGFFWNKRRKKRLQQEKELEVKNTQLKLSKRVHDVVANGIYQVMTKIENQEHFDKEETLDELEFVYEKSRDISYEKPDPENDKKDYKEKISRLIASFKNENTETYTVGNENEIWSGISQSVFEDIYQIIRELLVNMKKHSYASRVIYKFERIDDSIKIQYSDNGIGISGDIIHKNGLTNTGTRIAAIRGEIIFDNKSEKGLKINISFPVS
ncbi:tetratricopeptide repeat-containing sensor histidine kinase [Chryseobacterium shigense]|uniref:Signal transduction histidine kinase n=1 Tax=Chryseobacterium shigense TaxID=297244 RepID=A0A841N2V1_9FLAO|nr:tetratricopeptide repeat-containing sensor histidine kinase [Chryseobacterium shigense]MBB6371194.1 signal transduction histidine kinase [Chryseobacterium shigense]